MGCLLVASLKDVLFLCSNFGFPIIYIDSLVDIYIAYLIKFLENLTFLLNSALSFFDWVKPKELL